MKNKKLFLFAGVLITFITILTVVDYKKETASFSKVQTFYKNRDIESYNEAKEELTFIGAIKLKNLLISEIHEIEQDFVKEQINYHIATTRLKDILPYCDIERFTYHEQVKSHIDSLNHSRWSYIHAVDQENIGMYEQAHSYYSDVIKEDKNFLHARAKVAELGMYLKQVYLEKAATFAEKQEYETVIFMLNKAKTYDENDPNIDDKIEFYSSFQLKLSEYDSSTQQKQLITSGKIITGGRMTAVFQHACLTDSIYPDVVELNRPHYELPSYSEKTFLDIVFKLTNTTDDSLDICDLIDDPITIYDNYYKRKRCEMYYSIEDKIEYLHESMTKTIEPNQSVTFHVVFKIPKTAKTDGKSVETTFTFDGQKQILIFQ